MSHRIDASNLNAQQRKDIVKTGKTAVTEHGKEFTLNYTQLTGDLTAVMQQFEKTIQSNATKLKAATGPLYIELKDKVEALVSRMEHTWNATAQATVDKKSGTPFDWETTINTFKTEFATKFAADSAAFNKELHAAEMFLAGAKQSVLTLIHAHNITLKNLTLNPFEVPHTVAEQDAERKVIRSQTSSKQALDTIEGSLKALEPVLKAAAADLPTIIASLKTELPTIIAGVKSAADLIEKLVAGFEALKTPQQKALAIRYLKPKEKELLEKEDVWSHVRHLFDPSDSSTSTAAAPVESDDSERTGSATSSRAGTPPPSDAGTSTHVSPPESPRAATPPPGEKDASTHTSPSTTPRAATPPPAEKDASAHTSPSTTPRAATPPPAEKDASTHTSPSTTPRTVTPPPAEKDASTHTSPSTTPRAATPPPAEKDASTHASPSTTPRAATPPPALSEKADVKSDKAETKKADVKSDKAGVKSDKAETKKAGVKSEKADVKSDKAETKKAGVKSDKAGVKSDKAGVKSDKAGVKSDKAGVKSDKAGVKSDKADTKKGDWTDLAQAAKDAVQGATTEDRTATKAAEKTTASKVAKKEVEVLCKDAKAHPFKVRSEHDRNQLLNSIKDEKIRASVEKLREQMDESNLKTLLRKTLGSFKKEDQLSIAIATLPDEVRALVGAHSVWDKIKGVLSKERHPEFVVMKITVQDKVKSGKLLIKSDAPGFSEKGREYPKDDGHFKVVFRDTRGDKTKSYTFSMFANGKQVGETQTLQFGVTKSAKIKA